jgi:tetrahydromethanopterin S-methyltransferase subunit H
MNSEEEQNKIYDTYIKEINIWKKLYYDEMEAQKAKDLSLRLIIKSLEDNIIKEKDEKALIIQNFTNRISSYESRLVLYEKATKADYEKINNLKEENKALTEELNTLYSVSNNTPQNIT